MTKHITELSGETFIPLNSDSDTAAAVEAGQRIGRPVEVAPGLVATLNPVTGETTIHDVAALELDRDARPPARKTGQVTVRDADSLIEYIERHATEHTEVWADLERRAVLAVLDGHAPIVAGHQDHKAILSLRQTEAWKLWREKDGLYLPQETFAEFIEARQVDIIDPPGGDLLAIVTTIKSTTKADFESARRLSDGQTVLSYREETTTTAGKAGQFEVPETFTLGISPFEGSPKYRVTARLRVRIASGQLTIGYVLDNPKDIEAEAFADVRRAVDDGIDQAVLSGWPNA